MSDFPEKKLSFINDWFWLYITLCIVFCSPLLMWDSSLHLYKKYKTFTKKYNVLFCSRYSLRIIPNSGMGLGWTLCFDLWYGLGPSFISQLLVWAWAELNQPLLQKGMGYPLCGPISYCNFPTSNCNFFYMAKQALSSLIAALKLIFTKGVGQ